MPEPVLGALVPGPPEVRRVRIQPPGNLKNPKSLTRVYVDMCLCVYTHTHTYTYVYIYIYIHRVGCRVIFGFGGPGGGFGGFQVGSKSSGKPLLRLPRRKPSPGPPKP